MVGNLVAESWVNGWEFVHDWGVWTLCKTRIIDDWYYKKMYCQPPPKQVFGICTCFTLLLTSTNYKIIHIVKRVTGDSAIGTIRLSGSIHDLLGCCSLKSKHQYIILLDPPPPLNTCFAQPPSGYSFLLMRKLWTSEFGRQKRFLPVYYSICNIMIWDEKICPCLLQHM